MDADQQRNCRLEPDHERSRMMEQDPKRRTRVEAEVGRGARTAGGEVDTKRSSKSLPSTPKLSQNPSLQPDFFSHCRIFSHHMKGVNHQFEKIKECVLELYREVTTSKTSGPGYNKIELIVLDCAEIKSKMLCSILNAEVQAEIDEVDALLDRSRTNFKKKWEYELARIQDEQKVYRGQVEEISNLKEDLSRLLKIAQQIEPYLRCKERAAAEPVQTLHHKHPARVERGEEKCFQEVRMCTTDRDEELQDHCRTISRQQSKSLPRRAKQDFYGSEYGAAAEPGASRGGPQAELRGPRGAGSTDLVVTRGDESALDLGGPPYQEKNEFVWECEHPKQGGILSSILDKVCLKNDNLSLECLPWRTENTMSYKNCSDSLKYEKESARRSQENLDCVQKPYEPPCLGKSSRITPVKAAGNEEMAPGVKPLKYSDSVEVLSVIRYNKMKNGNTTPSPINFDSSSDMDSIYGQPTIHDAKLESAEKIDKYRNRKGREISRSMSMSHPPGEETDGQEPEPKPEKKFYSLGRHQEKELCTKYPDGDLKTDKSETTDLRNLHGPESGAGDAKRSSGSCHDLPVDFTFHEADHPAQRHSQRNHSQSSPTFSPQEGRPPPPPPALEVHHEPVYSESKKKQNRNLELISELLNPGIRDPDRQLQILGQLLNSDLSRMKDLVPEQQASSNYIYQDTQHRYQSQQSELRDSIPQEPARGYSQPTPQTPNHNQRCDLNRHFNTQPKPTDHSRSYSELPERSKPPDAGRADLIQKLLQAELNQSELKKSDLLEQLLGHGQQARLTHKEGCENTSRTLPRQLGQAVPSRGEQRPQQSRNQEQQESRRTVKEKGYGERKSVELKKRDSFEGHELAVECLVNAVQECRKAGSKISKRDEFAP